MNFFFSTLVGLFSLCFINTAFGAENRINNSSPASITSNPESVKFLPVQIMPDGTVNLEMFGFDPAIHVLEGSSDLSNWRILSGALATNNQVLFNSGLIKDVPHYFYRVVKPTAPMGLPPVGTHLRLGLYNSPDSPSMFTVSLYGDLSIPGATNSTGTFQKSDGATGSGTYQYLRTSGTTGTIILNSAETPGEQDSLRIIFPHFLVGTVVGQRQVISQGITNSYADLSGSLFFGSPPSYGIPTIQPGTTFRIEITSGKNSGLTYKVAMSGGKSGTFTIIDGPIGSGTYTYSQHSQNNSTLNFTFQKPNEKQHSMILYFDKLGGIFSGAGLPVSGDPNQALEEFEGRFTYSVAAPLVPSNTSPTLVITEGAFAGSSYKLILSGGSQGTFRAVEGVDGNGSYHIERTSVTNATLTVNWSSSPTRLRDRHLLTFTSDKAGSFMGTQRIKISENEFEERSDFAGTFSDLVLDLIPIWPKTHVRVEILTGPFTSISYGIFLQGGTSGTFKVSNGSTGSGNYTFNQTGIGKADLFLYYTTPSGDQDYFQLNFKMPSSGTFTSNHKLTEPTFQIFDGTGNFMEWGEW